VRILNIKADVRAKVALNPGTVIETYLLRAV